MAEVDAEDALVRIHQRQRVQLKPGDAGKRSQQLEQAAFLAAHSRGNTEIAAPSCLAENAIPFLPRLAADGIENECDAAAVGDFPGASLEILRSVIDEVVNAERAQFGVFGRGRSADDSGTDMFCDLGWRD